MPHPAGRSQAEPPAQAHVQVVAGNPTPEELAAVTAVLLAKLAAARRGVSLDGPGGQGWGDAATGGPAGASGRAGSRPGWPDRRALLRVPLSHGPGGWRNSARPR